MNDKTMTILGTAVIALVVGGFVGYAVSQSQSTAMYTNNNTNTDVVANTNVPTNTNQNESMAMPAMTDKSLKLYEGMQRLWADHVIWTREYINETIDGAPGATETANRLMKNQEDIGRAVAAYYGNDAGNKLTALLKDHINIAVQLIDAAKAGDADKFKLANTQWEANANDIALFLSGANPNWSKSAMTDAMMMHLRTTTDEVTTRLNKKYDQNVAAFDKVFDHIQKMADTLSAGIIKQFPDKF